MNYKHVYHAGSFTDVTKHVILFALIQALKRKDSPFCYIDTHAGTGCYDLESEFASKNKEYESGIEKILAQSRPPKLIKDYIDCVHRINNQLTAAHYASLRYYPGSPLIVKQLLRPHDRIVACELHPDEYQSLRKTFPGDKQVGLHHLDGFLGLKAFLPPPERRGLVLIDPPYEDPDEFTRLAHSLPDALKRWESGIYAVWYPIKAASLVERFYKAVEENVSRPTLAIELTTYPDLPQHLNGSGLVIINPPYQLTDTLKEILPWLWNALTNNGQGGYRTFFIKE